MGWRQTVSAVTCLPCEGAEAPGDGIQSLRLLLSMLRAEHASACKQFTNAPYVLAEQERPKTDSKQLKRLAVLIQVPVSTGPRPVTTNTCGTMGYRLRFPTTKPLDPDPAIETWNGQAGRTRCLHGLLPVAV
jgi:hypothetical protein